LRLYSKCIGLAAMHWSGVGKDLESSVSHT
jgi:hypothetical protein